MKTNIIFSSLITFSLLITGCSDDTDKENSNTTTNTSDQTSNQSNTSSNSVTCSQTIDDGAGGICVVDSYGDTQDDAAVRGIFNEVESFYAPDYSATFNLYVEKESINAFYTQDSAGSNYIFFGGNMFYTYKKQFPQTYLTAVTGIMAHEFGHNVQTNTYVDQSQLASQRQMINVGQTVVLQELEADAFSGLYMYFKFQSEAEFNTYFQMIYEIGDNEYTNAGHHGTAEQRQAAAAFGFLVADQIITNNLQESISYTEIRAYFLKNIAEYILFDRNWRSVKNESVAFELSEQNAQIIRAIAKGEKSTKDLNLASRTH